MNSSKRRALHTLLAAPLLGPQALTRAETPLTQFLLGYGTHNALMWARNAALTHSGWLFISRQWVDHSEIIPWCKRLGIPTLEALERRANDMSNVWSYPEVQAMTAAAPAMGSLPTIQVSDFHARILAAARATSVCTVAPGLRVQPNDVSKQLPTETYLDDVLQAFPWAHREFKYGHRECEEFTSMLTGWLAEQGLGNLAIGTAWLAMFRNGVKYPSGHVTLVATTQSGNTYWLEAKDRIRAPLTFIRFRGWRGNVEDNFSTADASQILNLVL